MNNELKKLQFRCWHRGMREIDILLGEFYDNFYESFTKEEITELNNYIIPLSDNDLYKCFTNQKLWPDNLSIKLIKKLNEYSNKRGLKNS